MATPTGAPTASTPSADTSSNNNWLWWLLVPLGLALLGGLLWLLPSRTCGAAGRPACTGPDPADLRAPDVNVPDARMPGAPLRRAPDVKAQPNCAARTDARCATVRRARCADAARRELHSAQCRTAETKTDDGSPGAEDRGTPSDHRHTPRRPARAGGAGRRGGGRAAANGDQLRERSDTNGEIEITYENNAIGANQESYDDKSDLHRPGGAGHRQRFRRDELR